MATLYFDLQWHKWHTINVDIATNYLPEAGKVFEAWLVDVYYEGSGYALRMNKILESGTEISWNNDYGQDLHRYSNNSKDG